MEMKKTLTDGLPLLGLALPEERIDSLCDFGRGVVKQNEVMNLTAITELYSHLTASGAYYTG